MKTAVEKGLASHSSIMVAPHDYITVSLKTSWASIVKKSIKTKVPKINFDCMDTSSSGSPSSRKNKMESKKYDTSPEQVIITPTEPSPPPIINISNK